MAKAGRVPGKRSIQPGPGLGRGPSWGREDRRQQLETLRLLASISQRKGLATWGLGSKLLSSFFLPLSTVPQR